MTDEQFVAWLKQDRDTYTVLCQIDYTEEVGAGSPSPGHLYLSTLAYSDAVNGRHYRDWIDALPAYSRDLTGDNLRNFGSTIGALVLNNADGHCDFIAELIIDGADVRFYVGDTSWPIADFRQIFVATASKATVPSKGSISIELRDSGILLNRSIGGEIKVGGDGPNAEQYRPVNIGYIAQAEAILLDVATESFVYNDRGAGLWLGETEQVVRDNGYPIVFIDNGDGTGEPASGTVGTITTNVMCTPAGDEARRLTSDIIDALVGDRAGMSAAGKYLGAQETFQVGDDEDWPLGINIKERTGLISVLADVCDSGQCFWAIDRLNRFFYGRLRPSYIVGLGVDASASVTDAHIFDGSFHRDTLDPKYYKLQAYVSKNWAIPSTTVAVDDSGNPLILTPDELSIVTRPGLAVSQGDSVGVSYFNAPELYHKTLSESEPIETLVSDPDDSVAAVIGQAWMEVARASQLPWLHVVSVTVPLQFYELELGRVVTVTFPGYGYEAGADFQVIGIDISLVARTVGLRLLRRHIQGPYAGRETIDSDPSVDLNELDLTGASGGLPPGATIDPMSLDMAGENSDPLLSLPGPFASYGGETTPPVCVEAVDYF